MTALEIEFRLLHLAVQHFDSQVQMLKAQLADNKSDRLKRKKKGDGSKEIQ